MYDMKKIRTGTKITVEELIIELMKENLDAGVLICGDDRIFIHAEENGSAVNLDNESLEECYGDYMYAAYNEIPQINP